MKSPCSMFGVQCLVFDVPALLLSAFGLLLLPACSTPPSALRPPHSDTARPGTPSTASARSSGIELAAAPEIYTATFTWPTTGETNRVMLDGVQQILALTNATLTVPVGRRSVSILGLSGHMHHTLVFSREVVVRWTGTLNESPDVLGVYTPSGLRVGQAITGPSRFFTPVLDRKLEIVTWWRWADREGLNL